MSTFNTPTTTHTPDSLTDQEKSDFRSQLDVYSKGESMKNPDEMDQAERTDAQEGLNVYDKSEAAQINGDYNQDFRFKDIKTFVDNESNETRRIVFTRGFSESEDAERGYIGFDFAGSKMIAQSDGGFYWLDSGTSGGGYAEIMHLFQGSGNLQIAGSYSPFTGVHIATSDENLNIGELVSIESMSLEGKQPLWHASYCEGSKKGVYGVVYDKQDDKYLIACVGDAIVNFSNENGPCEPGDYLVPASTKACSRQEKSSYPTIPSREGLFMFAI